MENIFLKISLLIITILFLKTLNNANSKKVQKEGKFF